MKLVVIFLLTLDVVVLASSKPKVKKLRTASPSRLATQLQNSGKKSKAELASAKATRQAASVKSRQLSGREYFTQTSGRRLQGKTQAEK